MKNAVLILSTVLMISFACPASATPETEKTTPAKVQVTTPAESSEITNYEPDNGDITVFDTQVIPPLRRSGGAAYTGKFTTAPANGKYLNVHCKNNGAGSVYMTISRNGVAFVSEIEITSGSQRTQTFEEQAAVGLSGDWEVYIFTKDGSKTDLSISARQY